MSHISFISHISPFFPYLIYFTYFIFLIYLIYPMSHISNMSGVAWPVMTCILTQRGSDNRSSADGHPLQALQHCAVLTNIYYKTRNLLSLHFSSAWNIKLKFDWIDKKNHIVGLNKVCMQQVCDGRWEIQMILSDLHYCLLRVWWHSVCSLLSALPSDWDCQLRDSHQSRGGLQREMTLRSDPVWHGGRHEDLHNLRLDTDCPGLRPSHGTDLWWQPVPPTDTVWRYSDY